MTAYYNEIEPYAAQWLRNLIAEGLVAPGDVDDRDIREVQPGDLRGYRQVHLFAGIGVWSYAARLAGWPDDRPMFTASCPCPPFSSAGKQFRCPECGTGSPVPNAVRTGAFDCIRCGHEWQADERHLWPEVFRLRRHYADVPLFGEQVASKDGIVWLDLVRASLEMVGNAVGHEVSPASSVGAPHIRQRVYFVAVALGDSKLARLEGHGGDGDDGREPGRDGEEQDGPVAPTGGAGGVGVTDSSGREAWRAASEAARYGSAADTAGGDGGLADADGGHPGTEGIQRGGEHGQQPQDGGAGRLGHADSEPGERGAGSLSGEEAQGAGARRPDGRHDHRHLDAGEARGLADATGERGGTGRSRRHAGDRAGVRDEAQRDAEPAGSVDRPGPTNGFWRDADWLGCRDGKWRPVEPGTSPLVDGAAFRVGSGSPYEGKSRAGMLKAYGNAIVAEQAAEFIRGMMETL